MEQLSLSQEYSSYTSFTVLLLQDFCHHQCKLDSWIFDSFILADETFAKALWSLETCVLVNNNVHGEIVSSLELPTIFDERFKVTGVLFFISDVNLLSSELGNFTFIKC